MADGRESYIISAEFDGKGIKDGKKEIRDFEHEATNSCEKIDSSLKKLGASIGGVFALQQLKQFAGQIVSARAEIEKYEVSFRTLLGDRQLADDFFGEIREFAVNTPLLLKDLASGAQTMLGFNIEAEKVIPTMKQIGDIAMGDQAKFQSLTLAFSQMSATGKLMGQDLMQMINAGFNPLSEISRTTGKSISQLKDEMEKGQISAEMVADAFESATSEGGQFFGMLEAQSKTITGAMSNLQGAIDDAFNSLGESAQPLITGTIDGLTTLVKHLDDVGKALMVLIATVGTYKAASLVAGIMQEVSALGSLTAAIKSTTIAQTALNAVMKANPYAIAVSGIIAITGALVAFIDTTSAEEKAVNSLQKEQEEYNKEIEEERSKIDNLLRVVKDETKTEGERNEALEDLRSLYPSIFKQYSTATDLINDMADAQARFNALLREQKELQGEESYGRDKALLDKIRRIKKNGGDSYDLNTNLSKEDKAYLTTAGVGLLGAEAYLTKRVNAADAQRAKSNQANYMASIGTMTNDALNKDKERWKELIQNMDKSGKKYVQTADGFVLSYEQVVSRLKSVGEQVKANTTWAGTNLFKDAKNAYEKADAEVKRLQGMAKAGKHDGYANEQAFNDALKKAEAEKKSAKEKYESYGGTVTTDKQNESAAKKAKKDAEERAKRQAQLSEEEYKQKKDAERKKIDLELAARQMELDAEKDSASKRMEQLKLNYAKRKEEIKREEEDIYEQNYEAAKKLYELENKDKQFGGNREDYRTLTDEQKNYLEAANKANVEALTNGIKDEVSQQEEYMREYLEKYGTLQEKKLAIEKKYAKQIEEASKQGNTGLVLSLQNEMQSALSTLDFEKLKESINWELVFGGLEQQSKKTLRAVKTDLEKFARSAEFKKASEADKKAINEALANLSNAINEKSTLFAGVHRAIEDRKRAIEELKAAEEELKDAEEEYARVMNSGNQQAIAQASQKLQQAKSLKNSKSNNLQNAEGELARQSASTADRVLQVANALGELGSSSEASLAALGKFVAQVMTAIGGEGSSLSKIGGFIGAAYAMDEQVEKSGGIEKFTGNILNQIGTSFIHSWNWGNWMGISNNVKECDKTIKEANTKNAVLAQRMSSLNETIQKGDIFQLDKAVNDAKQLTAEMMKNASAAMIAEADKHGTGRSSLHTSVEDNKGWKAAMTEVSKILGREISSSLQFLKLTGDEMAKIRDYDNGQTLQKILNEYRSEGGAGERSEALPEQILDYISKYEGAFKEIEKTAKERMMGITFDTMYNNWKSTLQDMSSSAAEFAKSTEKMVSDALIGKVADEYKDELEKLYTALYTAVKDDNYNEIARIKSEISAITESAREKVKDLESNGIVTNSDKISATSKSVASMSEDTATELNGRFTAIQISTYNIEGYVKSLSDSIRHVEHISTSIDDANSLLNTINGSIIACNGTLQAINQTNTNGFSNVVEAINVLRTAINSRL